MRTRVVSCLAVRVVLTSILLFFAIGEPLSAAQARRTTVVRPRAQAAATPVAQAQVRRSASPRQLTVTCGAGTNNWTGTAGDKQWGTAGNWSKNAVPVSTDGVCIASSFSGTTITIGGLSAANQTIASLTTGAPISFTSGPLTITGTASFSADLNMTSGTLTLSGTSSMTTFEQSSGTLTGAGALTVSGLLTWSGGTESGSGSTTANGGMSMSGEPFLDTRTMNNAGTANWTGVEFLMLNGSIFNNKSGATWNHQADSQIVFDGGTGPTFANAGTFAKTAGTNSSGGGIGSSVVFNNTGTVQANSGILIFGQVGICASTCGGSWTVASGATLQLGGGSSGTGAVSGPISGAGTVLFGTSGTVNYTGTYNVTGATGANGATANFISPGKVTSAGAVSITFGTLNFSTGSAVAATTMNQSAGTLTGSDTVTFSGMATWSGGTQSGSGTTTANGGMSLSGEPFLDTRTMNNKGTATWTGIEFLMLNGSTFNNQSGGTWDHQGDTQIVFDGGTAPTFSNAGTFKKSTGTNSSGGGVGNSVVFNNTGAVQANSGILLFGQVGTCGSTCAGSWSAASGATLQIGGGSSGTGALSGPISGAGTVQFGTSGTVNYTGTYNVTGGTGANGATANFMSPGKVTSTGAITITFGTLNFSTGSAVAATTLNQSGGTLTGSDTLTFSAMATWSGGTQSGSGTTTANGGMNISGEPFLDTRTMNNKGTATWTGIEFLMLDGSMFNNQSGATWDHQGDTQIVYDGGTTPTFANAGTFKKSTGTNNSGGGVGGSLVFNNTGAVQANSGILLIQDVGTCGSTCGGSWTAASGATLQLGSSGTGALSGPVTGAGTVTFNTGTVNYTGSYNVTGTTGANGGTVNFTAPGTVTSAGKVSITFGTLNFSTGKAVKATTLNQSGGTLTGSDAVTFSSTAASTWSGGTQSGTGSTTVSGNIAVSGEPFLDTRTFNNSKTATWSGAEMLMLNGSILNNKGTWNHQGDTQIVWDGGTTPVINNSGTFEKTAGTNSSGGGLGSSITFNNTGTVIAKAGILLLGNGFTQTKGSTLLQGGNISMSGSSTLNAQAGSVFGSGTITGNLTNTAGTVSPSLFSPKVTTGTLSVSGSGVGNYSQGAGGIIQFNIAGSGAGQVDTLNTSGSATLAGTAILCLINGFKPAIGTKFPVMNYASQTGSFSKVQFGWSMALGSTSAMATYNGAPSDTFSAASITFPSQLINTTSSPMTETLTNNGQATLDISSITKGGTNASDFTITNNQCGSTLTVGNSCTITLTFTPSALGSRSATLTIVDDACGSPHVIPLSGKGTEITMAPSPVAFGNQAVGTTSAPMTVTLTNHGTTTVTVTGATITGTNKTDFKVASNGCTTIAADGGNCTIKVTFTPSATGARSGTLSVTDNDKGSPQTDALTGTGQ